MKPTTEKTDEGIAIHWNPEIEPELEEYSEKSLAKSSEPMKYSSLSLWAHNKWRYDDKYKQYKQYEENLKLALKDVKEIISKLKKTKSPEPFKLQHSAESAESGTLFNILTTFDGMVSY